MNETIPTPDGQTADYYGPSAALVRHALDHAGYPKAAAAAAGRPEIVGYIVRKPRDVAYVEVSATGSELTEQYRAVLASAGFLVEDNRWRKGELVVFAAPGHGVRPRAK